MPPAPAITSKGFGPPVFATAAEERLHRKRMLAAAFRLFSRFGFDEGVAGHITARDPEKLDHFWVNPFGMHFGQIRASDLILVNHHGEVVEGKYPVNGAAFAIHSRVHGARPNVIAAAHAHSMYGKSWASLGRLLDPITQDACAFYEDHAVFADFTGVVYETSEGERIAQALGQRKAAILQNHGLLTVGQCVEEAAWWFITMDRSCQAQLLSRISRRPRKRSITPPPSPPGNKWEATWQAGSNSNRSSLASRAKNPTCSNSSAQFDVIVAARMVAIRWSTLSASSERPSPRRAFAPRSRE